MAVPEIRLNNGVSVPQLGLGVFQVGPDDAQRVVETALDAGYRHVDTAAAYNNESGVGAAVRASGLPREEVFVTSKLRNGDQGEESVWRAYADSCERLGLDHLDLYLIHWPNPAAGLYVQSWRAMERLFAEEAVRAIGVSNFLVEHLDELLRSSDVVPAVNQIELHPTFQQQEVSSRCRQEGITVQAYSPLGQGADLDAAAVRSVADAHGVSPAQAILRWHLQRGRLVIPKSGSPERIRENLDVTNFTLTDDEVDLIAAMDAGNRIGGDPTTFSLSQIR